MSKILKTVFYTIFLLSLFFSCPVDAEEKKTSYSVTIRGSVSDELLQRLREVSHAVELEKKSPEQQAYIRGVTQRDATRMRNVLEAEGYYSAEVSWDIDAGDMKTNVTFTVKPGPAYILKQVHIQNMQGQPAGPEQPFEIGLRLNEPLKARPTVNSQDRLVLWFKNHGYPFIKVENREIVVDHAANSASITYTVNPGPPAEFGEIHFSGLETVDPDILRNQKTWETGRRYKESMLTAYQTRLAQTRLFGVVRVLPGDTVTEHGRVPIIVELKERKHHSVGFGIGFRTDEGLRLNTSWVDRNLLGKAEQLEISGMHSSFAKAVAADFTKPQFGHPDQSLNLNMRVAEDNPDAYTSRNFTALATLRREIAKSTNLGGGLAYKYSDVIQAGEEESFSHIYLPILFDWDTSDDLLMPTQGGRMNVLAAPFYDTRGNDFAFWKGWFKYSRYSRLSRRPLLIVANRMMLGSISGANRNNIPPDERFYAGGGGSIRGYEYQTVSPLEDESPLGGRSLFEFATELRLSVTEKIGIVPFIDGGNVYTESMPVFSGELFWGAGIGFRYSTGLGPLRVDLAFPLNRRDIDNPYQLYINFGQSF